MAGFNTRFHDAGFDIPKYLLPWGDKTIIHEILNELTRNTTFEEIILLANRRDAYFLKKLELAVADFPQAEIAYIGDTLGQAHTAAIGAGMAQTDGALFIHNADTVLTNRNFEKMTEQLSKYDAVVDVFSADNPKYCYVEVDDHLVTEILEKQKVTNIASSGLYGFKSPSQYITEYKKALDTHRGGEVYISNVLSNILKEGFVVATELSAEDETLVIGSPQEYSKAISEKQNESNPA